MLTYSQAAVELLERAISLHPNPESRDSARRALFHEYAALAQRRQTERDASRMVEGEGEGMEMEAAADETESDESESDDLSLIEASVSAAKVSGSKSETDANSGAKLSPVDTPQNLVGAPRMTPACRRQLHNYLTDCVFDGKSADANTPKCYQIYSVWARDCFNGGVMPSEKDGGGGEEGGGDE